MPLAQGGNYNYGNLNNAGCGPNGGIVTVTGVSTDAVTTLSYLVTDGEGLQVGAYSFPGSTINGEVSFDNLPDGVIYVEISASSGQQHFWNTTVSCGTGGPAPGCDTITGVTENANGTITVLISQNDTKTKRYQLNGGNWQTSNIFPNPGVGVHSVSYRTSPTGCFQTFGFQIGCNIAITGVETSGSTATVHATTAPGRTLEYSLDRVKWQVGNVFTKLMPLTFTVWVRDNLECEAHTTFDITAPGNLTGRCFIVYEGTFYPIPQPVDYPKFERVFKRDPVYYGIGYDNSEMKVGFNCHHRRDLITQVLNTKGPEAEILLFIRDCSDTNPPRIFRLNLYDVENSDAEIKCNLEKTGLQDLIRTRFKTKVEIGKTESLDLFPVTQVAPVNVNLHSRAIVQKYEAFSDGVPAFSPLITTSGPGRTATIGLGFTDIRTMELEGFENGGTGFSFQGSNNELYTAPANGPHKLEFVLNTETMVILEDGDFDTAELKLLYRINNGPEEVLHHHLQNPVNGDYYHTAYVAQTKNLNLNIGDKIYLWGWLEARTVTGSYKFTFKFTLREGSFIRLTAETTTPATVTQAYKPLDLLNNAAALISSKPGLVKSDYYGTGCGKNRVLTNGFFLRGFPFSEKKINVSIGEIVDGLKAIDSAGFGYEKNGPEEVIRVEPIEYFFKNELGGTFRIIESYAESVAKEFIFSAGHFGYEKWGDENINGLEEFNAKQTRVTSIKKHKNELNAISPFIAAGSTIELTRRKRYATAGATDYKHDNSIFVICTNPANPGEAEKNQNFEIVNGIFSPETAYNLRISPARNFLNWGKWLNSGLYFSPETDFYNYASGEGNNKLQTKLAAGAGCLGSDPDRLTITQNEALTKAQTNQGQRIFKPFYMDVVLRIPEAMFDFVLLNMYKYFQFWNGEKGIFESGYLLEAKYNEAEQKAIFKLIKKA